MLHVETRKPTIMILATLCYIKHNGRTLMVHRNRKPNDIHAG